MAMGGTANADDDTRAFAEAPALSLIVAVDVIHAGVARSLKDMLRVVGDTPCELIVASREAWPDAPAGVGGEAGIVDTSTMIRSIGVTVVCCPGCNHGRRILEYRHNEVAC